MFLILCCILYSTLTAGKAYLTSTWRNTCCCDILLFESTIGNGERNDDTALGLHPRQQRMSLFENKLKIKFNQSENQNETDTDAAAAAGASASVAAVVFSMVFTVVQACAAVKSAAPAAAAASMSVSFSFSSNIK